VGFHLELEVVDCCSGMKEAILWGVDSGRWLVQIVRFIHVSFLHVYFLLCFSSLDLRTFLFLAITRRPRPYPKILLSILSTHTHPNKPSLLLPAPDDPYTSWMLRRSRPTHVLDERKRCTCSVAQGQPVEVNLREGAGKVDRRRDIAVEGMGIHNPAPGTEAG
jgi:hypothetical protein